MRRTAPWSSTGAATSRARVVWALGVMGASLATASAATAATAATGGSPGAVAASRSPVKGSSAWKHDVVDPGVARPPKRVQVVGAAGAVSDPEGSRRPAGR